MATFGFILCLSVALAGFSLGQDSTPSTSGQVEEVLDTVQEVLGIVQDLKAENDQIKAKQQEKQEKKAARKAANAGFLDPVKEEKKAAKKAARAAASENCAQVQEAGNTENGIYTIYPKKGPGIQVYCDLTTDGGGWTVFQRRLDGSVDFDREWADYENGFGNVAEEYWFGLAHVRAIVEQEFQVLRVELEDWDGTTAYATYQEFEIGPPEDNYRLKAESFKAEYSHYGGDWTGNLGDDFHNYHTGYAFATKDKQNDDHRRYAVDYTGGWWFGNGYRCNLNGPYFGPDHVTAGGMEWNYFNNRVYNSLKKTEMKMRPSVFTL